MITERLQSDYRAIIIETKRLLKILSRKFQSKQAQWGNLIGHCDFAVFCLFFAFLCLIYGHILVVSIWIKSSIMTSFSEIGQLSLDFWTKKSIFLKIWHFLSHKKHLFWLAILRFHRFLAVSVPFFCFFVWNWWSIMLMWLFKGILSRKTIKTMQY